MFIGCIFFLFYKLENVKSLNKKQKKKTEIYIKFAL